MDEAEQNRYVSQLKGVFDSCDTTGTGYLDQEELTELCHKLHLEAHVPVLLKTLLGTDHYARVNFEEFKEGFVAVLSNSLELSTSEDESSYLEPAVPEEVKPKYVKGTKRYGRRSQPEIPDSEVEITADSEEPLLYKPTDLFLPGSRRAQLRRSTSLESVESLKSDEETASSKEPQNETFEAQGQMRTWNPDVLDSPRQTSSPRVDSIDVSDSQVQAIWAELGVGGSGYLSRQELSVVCDNIGLTDLHAEELDDLFRKLDKNRNGRVSLSEFQRGLFRHSPLSAHASSTPCKPRLKRALHQAFEESPHRTATPSLLCTITGPRLLSCINDGTGYVNPEQVISIWREEGISNSKEILQTLEFRLDEKLNLSELTHALDNELLVSRNGLHQAALVSYKNEIQFLQGQVEQSCKERDKVKADLEKAEKRSLQLAREVDDRHAAMEHLNDSKVKDLEQDYKEKLSTLRSEMDKERELIMQQTNKQRAKLEEEIDLLRANDAILQEEVSVTTKENSRLEKEVDELVEKLADSQKTVSKLQKDLDLMLMEKFGSLDPHNTELFNQEERFAEIIKEFEQQCRELRDRNDELQSELELLRAQVQDRRSRHSLRNNKPLRIEADSRVPPTDSDSDDADIVKKNKYLRVRRYLPTAGRKGSVAPENDPANISIETEMAVEQIKEKHQQEVQDLKIQLETKVNFYERNIVLMNRNVELERKNIEQDFKIEISELEEQKAELEEKCERLQGVIAELREQLQRPGQSQDLEKRFHQERADMEQYYAKEITGLAERLNKEKNQLELELHEKHEEEMVQLRKEAADLKQRLSQMETQHAEAQHVFLQQNHKLQKLQEKFSQEKHQWEVKERDRFEEYRKEKLRTEEKMNEEQVRICNSFAMDKKVMEDQYMEQINQLNSEIGTLKTEFEKMRSMGTLPVQSEGWKALKKTEAAFENRIAFIKDQAGLTKQLTSDLKLKEEEVEMLKRREDDLLSLKLQQKQHLTPVQAKRSELKEDQEVVENYSHQDKECQQLQTLLQAQEEDAKLLRNKVQDMHEHLKNSRDEVLQLKARLKSEEDDKERLLEKEKIQSSRCEQLQIHLKTQEEVLTLLRRKKQDLLDKLKQRELDVVEQNLKLQFEVKDKEGLLEEITKHIHLCQQLSSGLVEKAAVTKETTKHLLQLQHMDPLVLEHGVQLDSEVKERGQLKTKLKEKLDILKHNLMLLKDHMSTIQQLSAKLKDKEEEVFLLRKQAGDLSGLLQQREQEAQTQMHQVKEEFEMEKNKLKDQLLQMEKLVTKLEAVSGEGRTHRAQLQGVTEENAALKEKLAICQQDVQKLEVDVNRQRKQTEQMKSEKEMMQSEVKLLFKENTRYRDEVFEISTRNLQLSSENADLNAKIKADQSTIQLLNERLAQISLQKEEEAVVTRQLQEASGRLEREQLQQQSGWQRDKELMEQELQISKEKLQRLKEVESEFSSLTLKHQWLEQDKESLVKELEEQNEKIERLETALQNVSDQADELRSALQAANQDKGSLTKETVIKQKILQEAEDKIKQLEMNVQRLRQEKEQLQTSYRQADEQETLALRKECESLHSQLQQCQHKIELIHAQESELQRVNQECQTLRRKQTQLETDLVEAQDQLLEASTTLTLAQSQHVREVQQLKEQAGAAVPRDQLAQLQSQLAEEEHRGQRLQEQINIQAEQASKQMALQQEQYKQVLKQMEERMEEVEAKLKNLRMVLQEKVTQLKEQLANNAKSNVLLKDLYVENSQLMKALQVTEQRQKSAEKKNFIMEEKIAALNKLLCKITPASLTA
ncbi:ninein-like protein isoform X1 [Acipenser ruthenus]|uniref:ninein-like protein isoform X1 n=1 Tax=Acipenser ruthenus TaxID=7906 RepID=UPI00274046D0|nr:ninein-like protein isoform X1 [Acipenser ruthenus]XP_058880086.1 ninein-like protein isoform X1 [Acipenser ruthenus]